MGLVAIVIALGGTAYAVSKAPKNSVVSKSIKNNQVKSADIGPNTVGGSELKAAGQFKPLTLNDGWSVVDSPDAAAPACFQDNVGIVHLQGLANAGPSRAFDTATLPAECRPDTNIRVAAPIFESNLDVAALGAVQMEADGSLNYQDSGAAPATGQIASFDGISYPADN